MGSRKEKKNKSSRAKQYFQYSRHVTGALSPEKIDFYREHPSFVSTRFPEFRPEWFQDLSSGFVLDTNVFCWVEQAIREILPKASMTLRRNWDQVWDVITESVMIQMNHLTQGLSHANTEQHLHRARFLRACPRLQEAGREKHGVLQIHRELTRLSENGNRQVSPTLLPGMDFVGDLVLLRRFPGHPILITYQMLVGVLDKIESRFSVLFYVLYMDQTEERAGKGTVQLFDDVDRILELTYWEQGNEATRLFKSLEPLVVGVSLQQFPKESNDHEFLSHLLMSLEEKSPILIHYANELIVIFREYLSNYGKDTIPLMIEQFGQEKLHFYPIISIEGGMKKMYEHGTSHRPISDQAARNIASNFKREYFVAFYEKHKMLPRTFEHVNVSPSIKKLLKVGKPGSIRECYKIPNDDWESLTFKKNHEFNYFPQISDLLDDKAITPHKSCLYQLFAADALKVIGRSKPRVLQNTRLILEILGREVIEIKKIFDIVEMHGTIPSEWGGIQLMSKEKELKIEARQFSILSFECRMMASSCERNLGEHILPLFKMQSMTSSGSELKHKMDVLSTLPETSDDIWIRFHMDLEQWNYTFRSQQQAHIISVLCDLFGVQHYRYMTNIFTDGFLFSANKFTPPGFPGVFTHWDNHAGGNQGILQKLWTLITIIIIRAVMHKLDLEHRLTGAGDNQVLFVRLKKGSSLAATIRDIKNELKVAFQDVGLALKLEETWESGVMTAYQRKYYLLGVLISAGIKLAARAFSGESDINCGINSIVTTAINGGMGLTEQSSDPLIGILFSYAEIFINLVGNPDLESKLGPTKEALVMLSFLSSDFGFLPFQQLSGFMYAGHQDTLTESFALLRYVWDNHHNYRAYISSVFQFKAGSHDSETILQLILEPTSLNISRPRLPEALIRSRVEAYLTDITNVRNRQLSTMFMGCQKPDQLQLAEELIKIRPINTSLLHSLFEYSPTGSLLGTLSRFNKISSIVKMVGMNQCGGADVCFSASVRELDTRNYRYFLSRLRPLNNYGLDFFKEAVRTNWVAYQRYCSINNLQTHCTFALRVYLIAFTYGLGDVFITGPYTPSPSEQLSYSDTKHQSITESSLIINPAFNIPTNMAQLESSRGPYHLYIGSRTGDPVRAVKLTSLDGVEAGTAIRTMLKILAWMKSTQSDKNVLDFVIKQLGVRMEGLEELIPGLVPGTAGGNIDHRFGSPGMVMWAFSNSTTLISTWYQITSNRATALHRGEEDRFVFFQQIFHHILSALRFCTPYTHRILANIELDHCSYLIPQSTYSAPQLLLPGSHRMAGGLVLDDDRRAALTLEAVHFTSVMSTTILHDVDPQLLLCSCIALEVTSSIVAYDLGINNPDMEEHRMTGGQTSINLSIMRQLRLEDLLRSMALHLAYQGFFGRRITPLTLLRRLNQRAQLSLAGMSVTPLASILQALVTAGMVPQLLVLTQHFWDWKGDTSLKSLVVPFFLGMGKALEAAMSNSRMTLLLLEVKGSHYSYRRLLSFLRYWDPQVRRILKINQRHPVLTQLSMINTQSSRLNIVCTTDVGIATESGRRRLNLGPQEDSSPSASGQKPIARLEIKNFSTPPWIHIRSWVSTGPGVEEESGDHLWPQPHKWPMASKIMTDLMRWNRGPSRGAFKLVEILSRCEIRLPENSLVLCAGEGAGSFLSSLLHIYPSCLGMYNSRVYAPDVPPAMAGKFIPPGLFCKCNLLDRVINVPMSSATYGDLEDPHTLSELLTDIHKSGRNLSLLTLDVQYERSSFGTVIRNISWLIAKTKPEHLIMKVTIEALQDLGIEWAALIESHFNLIEWIKPAYSNLYSTEIYLVGKEKAADSSQGIKNTLGHLLNRWEALERTVTETQLGMILLEGIRLSGDMNYCPSILTDRDRLDLNLLGSIPYLLQPLFAHYLTLTVKKFHLHIPLSRSEQIVTHSLSAQAHSSKTKVNSVLLSVLMYLRMRNTLPVLGGHDMVLSFILNNYGEFHKILSALSADLNSEVIFSKVLECLGILLYADDKWEADHVQQLAHACFIFFQECDKFGFIMPLTYKYLQEMQSYTARNNQSRHFAWVQFLGHPLSFVLIDKLLVSSVKSLGLGSCRVTCQTRELSGWVEGLPWSAELREVGTHILELVNSLDGHRPTYGGSFWRIPIVLERVFITPHLSWTNRQMLGEIVGRGRQFAVFTSGDLPS